MVARAVDVHQMIGTSTARAVDNLSEYYSHERYVSCTGDRGDTLCKLLFVELLLEMTGQPAIESNLSIQSDCARQS